MFWTAFIWGLGVSCGASVGLLLFVFTKYFLEWLLGVSEKFDKFHRESLELSGRMIAHLESIAESAESLARGDDG